MCKASDVSPERLAPNKALRTVSSVCGLVLCLYLLYVLLMSWESLR